METRESSGENEPWLRMALQPLVIRRAALYAVVVGAILIAINHGGALLAGDVSGNRIVRMVLTTAVPYVVSTLSSVGAMRAMEARSQGFEDPNGVRCEIR
jgi:hypothetical protein